MHLPDDDMTDLGGEPACWSHLLDELDVRSDDDRVVQVDLTDAGDGVGGVVWSLPHDGDLDANVIRLAADGSIEHHVNVDLDVLILVWEGSGQIAIDGRILPLGPGAVTLVPKGTSRAISAGQGGMSYLTVHRRRGPLTIGRR